MRKLLLLLLVVDEKEKPSFQIDDDDDDDDSVVVSVVVVKSSSVREEEVVCSYMSQIKKDHYHAYYSIDFFVFGLTKKGEKSSSFSELHVFFSIIRNKLHQQFTHKPKTSTHTLPPTT